MVEADIENCFKLFNSCGILWNPFLKNKNGKKINKRVIRAEIIISLYCFFWKYKKPKITGYIFREAAKASAIQAIILLYLISES